MKTIWTTTLLLTMATSTAHAEYKKVDMTVFGMDCAPCAHAVRVSMKGIHGVNNVEVNLNTGLVVVQLDPGNTAGMRQFNEAIEKNGFTHKQATVMVVGTLTGTAAAPVLLVTGTSDHYLLAPQAQPAALEALMGKSVTVEGAIPEVAKGKLPDTLKYTAIAEVK